MVRLAHAHTLGGPSGPTGLRPRMYTHMPGLRLAARRAVFRLFVPQLLELLQLVQRFQLPKLLPLFQLHKLLRLFQLRPAWGIHFCIVDLATGPALTQLRVCHGQP